MKTKILSFMLMVAALVIAGCSTPAMRIKHNPELFASIPPAQQELIKQGQISIGFTPDMVKLSLGEPDYVARKIDKDGTSEIWRYRSYDASEDYGFGGYYGWGGPYNYRGYYGWGGGWYGGWPGYYGFAAPAPQSDYLRVTIREGRVIQIDQLR